MGGISPLPGSPSLSLSDLLPPRLTVATPAVLLGLRFHFQPRRHFTLTFRETTVKEVRLPHRMPHGHVDDFELKSLEKQQTQGAAVPDPHHLPEDGPPEGAGCRKQPPSQIPPTGRLTLTLAGGRRPEAGHTPGPALPHGLRVSLISSSRGPCLS